MASDISWEFDELQAYIKRLVATIDHGVTPDAVGEVHGPGAGTVNAATPFRMELKFTALDFAGALKGYYTELEKMHDTLMAVLAAAVEADASLADEARGITDLIDSAAAASTPAKSRVTPEDIASAGQIG